LLGITSVIKIYGLAAMVDDALGALSVAESKGVNLNVRHFNAVINVCRKHKRYEDAVMVYELLLKASENSVMVKNNKGKYTCKSILPDVASRSSIIGVLGSMGEWERALKIFQEVEMTDRDTILYTTILTTLEKSGKVVESLKVFEEMMIMSNEKVDKSIKINTSEKNLNNSNRKVVSNVMPSLQMYTSIISVLGMYIYVDLYMPYVYICAYICVYIFV
jgi:pentatricopeptide repeat protein